jgi:hypothetical protein
MKREDLVEIARDCYDQELANRGLSNRGLSNRGLSGAPAKPETEPTESPRDTQGFVEVTTFPSFQEASLARAVLASVAIPASLEREHFVAGGVRLMVPPEFREEAREALDSPLSDEELAAQAEAEPPPEDI